MGIFRWLALGAAGAVAYNAWQKRQAAAGTSASGALDDGRITPPHGDAITVGGPDREVPDAPSTRPAHSSRSFGEED
ncbi:hypothetical protein [Luteimonas sp. TWI1416]|uniref:hypothetical protein n=1 Tax=unclassified Luteimonas TaxID=2629088 RepID=UPI0032079E55